jgi:uncharacterized membrane protein
VKGITYAIVSTVFYGVFDVFVKLAAGKIESGVTSLVINATATLVLFVYVLVCKYKGVEQNISKEGFWFAMIAGVVICFASVTFNKMFTAGINLSMGVTIVRVGMVILGVTLGILVFRDKLAMHQALGIVFSLVGLGLLLLK